MTDQHASTTAAASNIRHPDLAGMIAVLTGGSRGIGAATARALAGTRRHLAAFAGGGGAPVPTAIEGPTTSPKAKSWCEQTTDTQHPERPSHR